MADIAVLGAEVWGTALAVMADRCGHRVRIWVGFSGRIGTDSKGERK